ncbi:phosphopantetheine-binding protein [Roseovarius sp.]|uniref:acyl carrier protein n=1 Tax=Roseovarius sp. TaxID=1486281 RepID=UPI000C67B1C8|nr:phosphopantetheine-binding protein [Roseovarius sp.]MAZ21156.1 acyl carrier protein [Roseovarius sp.]|tara:strand:- start:4359 stop:4583 length:225 start_codon:yes stop_codon:yes gene_type:complete
MTLTNDELMDIIRDADTQIDFSKLDADTPFDSANADSLDLMNILLGVQEKLDIEIPDDEVENLNTVNKILSYVN